jgi:hypothetical protein
MREINGSQSLYPTFSPNSGHEINQIQGVKEYKGIDNEAEIPVRTAGESVNIFSETPIKHPEDNPLNIFFNSGSTGSVSRHSYNHHGQDKLFKIAENYAWTHPSLGKPQPRPPFSNPNCYELLGPAFSPFYKLKCLPWFIPPFPPLPFPFPTDPSFIMPQVPGLTHFNSASNKPGCPPPWLPQIQNWQK